MNSTLSLSQQVKDELIKVLRDQDSSTEVSVQRNSLGWLTLRVVTADFEGQAPSDRERKIDAILTASDLTLGQYPFAGYALLTPAEAAAQPPFRPVQLPLWSEILMAPEPDQPAALEEDISKRPFVVTFYSFKGGVGRTTALGMVAGLLAARRRRVVMIDFDLEAPGLSFMFPSSSAENGDPPYGVVDYLYQRYLTPEDNTPNIGDCVRQIDLLTRGDLYLVPAGGYDEGYIHRLADLDMRLLYQREANPVHALLDDVKAQLDPDVILIDARTGLTEIGAVALFDLADLAVVCFSPNDQSFGGLRWVVQAARKQQDYRGIPDLRFLLTPIPPISPAQHQNMIARAADWIAENWRIPDNMEINDLYYEIMYNPNIAILESVVNSVPSSLLESYRPVAEVIDASLSERGNGTTSVVTRIYDQIRDELVFRAATAQEMKPEDIPAFFQRTEDFPQFLDSRFWLIRGAKGTGKSLLFRLFVERSSDAKELAKHYTDLANVLFIPGHGRPELSNTMLTSVDLSSFEQQTREHGWQLFWLNYALLQLCSAHPELRLLPVLDRQLASLAATKPSHADIISWLVQRAQSPQSGPQAIDEVRALDQWLHNHDKKVWLFYDELDSSFGPSHTRRRALEALFVWWLEIGSTLTAIVPKILLRDDIWSGLNFTNRGHYTGRSLRLRWDEKDLWHLVLRQALDSPSFAKAVHKHSGLDKDGLDGADLAQLRKSLTPLWGERMGRTKKAYTYNWVRNRITDSQNGRFPRSLILLLQKGIELEKGYRDLNTAEASLRPRALIEALPYVSEQRVEEVRNEYPEFAEHLTKLQGQRSPIALSHLGEIWGIQSPETASLAEDMVKAGILQRYTRLSALDSPLRYAVAELYLSGLGMTRLGQK